MELLVPVFGMGAMDQLAAELGIRARRGQTDLFSTTRPAMSWSPHDNHSLDRSPWCCFRSCSSSGSLRAAAHASIACELTVGPVPLLPSVMAAAAAQSVVGRQLDVTQKAPSFHAAKFTRGASGP